MDTFSRICEMMMLLCFAIGWPLSIIKTLRSKTVKGKSPLFIMVVILGYIFGIVHKIMADFDWVSYLYIFNLTIVSVDLLLYFRYKKLDLMRDEDV